jgi:hypothetical protein
MKFTVEVTPGDYATETDLRLMRENIRLALTVAVGDVANNVFHEYVFSDVTVDNCHEPPF